MLPSTEALIETYGLRQKKSLGQHFLTDEALLSDIVAYAGDISQHTIIEVGPGPGGLTRALLQAGAKHVFAIEKDERAIPVLQELARHAEGRLEMQLADATQLILSEYGDAPRAIVANLPYNVGTDMLISWLHQIAENPQVLDRMVLMFQQEVGERIVAQPGSKAYGRVSVLAQWLCETHLVQTIPPQAFSPPPKVNSAVVIVVPRPQPLVACQLPRLTQVVSMAFSQRRKMLRATLKPLGAEAMATLPNLGIDPQSRAENVTPKQFAELALWLDQPGNKSS
ncbi:MAG: 16S rRNA (adenine(1518)-N(6)/adenine(1519)-N(6))-dimethyltransferase [Rickettsiales bacterium]|nr:16S rRNA (adenine(1518)-N(6)/adenine(1519)-N(6))-dimethyltransferase [Rickettsiales bacterium]